jgi:hypothetical protein
VQHSENAAKQQSLDEQGLHAESASAVSTSSKIALVNLAMNFADKNWRTIKLDQIAPIAPLPVTKVLMTPHTRIVWVRSP